MNSVIIQNTAMDSDASAGLRKAIGLGHAGRIEFLFETLIAVVEDLHPLNARIPFKSKNELPRLAELIA